MIWLALYFDLPAKSGKIEPPTLSLVRREIHALSDENFEGMMRDKPEILKLWRLEEIK